MMKMDDSNNVLIKYNDREFNLKNHDDYKEFVIILTDPINDFDSSCLQIDEDQDEKSKSICIKYKEFFEKFLREKPKAIIDGKKMIEELISEK